MKNKSKFRFGMFLVTIGIVYGDIGTSPMYVMKSILEGNGHEGGQPRRRRHLLALLAGA